MKPRLRTRHRRIWMVWAVLLPLLFVWAYLSIPRVQLQTGTYPDSSTYSSSNSDTE